MRLGAVMVALSVACGPKPAPVAPPAPKPTPAPEKVRRLAVLKADSDRFPKVAAEINAATVGVYLLGVDETFRAEVSLEVVQLSIECVEDTPTCLQEVGSSLS